MQGVRIYGIVEKMVRTDTMNQWGVSVECDSLYPDSVKGGRT